MVKKFLTSGLLASVLAAALLFAAPASTTANDNDEKDVVRATLYRDGSISCTGADDTSKKGGKVILFPAPGVVHFKVKLRNAAPNAAYTVAISEEPTCANPQFYPPVTTDSNGNADIYGTYTTTAGTHDLLVNMSTTTPDVPRNREIGTKNVQVTVP